MENQAKFDLLNTAVDTYCKEYLRGTKNGRCDGKCSFQGKCSMEYIAKHPRKIQNLLNKHRKVVVAHETV